MTERITTAGIALEDGRVLVAKRIQEGVIGGKWEFPGGKNRWGESPEETLKREWREELSLEIEAEEELFTTDFINNGVLYHLKAFRVRLLTKEARLSVHSALRWVDAKELGRLDLAGSDRKISDYLVDGNIVRECR